VRSRVLPLLCALAASVLVAPGLARAACGSTGYSYAGVATSQRVYGVAAALTSLAAPAVQNGHVAGWVGVGGPNEGPHGTSEWIQVGFSGFPGLTVGSLYYEVALPGQAPRYYEVLSNVHPGDRHRIAVLEVAHHRDMWRVWVDGRRVGHAYRLPGSHGRWQGVATAENWGGGAHACNRYAYRFDRFRVAGSPGGSWHVASRVYRMQQGSNRLLMNAHTSFVAHAGTLPRRTVPKHRPRPAATTPARGGNGAKTASSVEKTPTAVAPTPAPAPADPAAPPADPNATAAPVDAATPPDATTAPSDGTAVGPSGTGGDNAPPDGQPGLAGP
jgi:hypothetical protein